MKLHWNILLIIHILLHLCSVAISQDTLRSRTSIRRPSGIARGEYGGQSSSTEVQPPKKSNRRGDAVQKAIPKSFSRRLDNSRNDQSSEPPLSMDLEVSEPDPTLPRSLKNMRIGRKKEFDDPISLIPVVNNGAFSDSRKARVYPARAKIILNPDVESPLGSSSTADSASRENRQALRRREPPSSAGRGRMRYSHESDESAKRRNDFIDESDLEIYNLDMNTGKIQAPGDYTRHNSFNREITTSRNIVITAAPVVKEDSSSRSRAQIPQRTRSFTRTSTVEGSVEHSTQNARSRSRGRVPTTRVASTEAPLYEKITEEKSTERSISRYRTRPTSEKPTIKQRTFPERGTIPRSTTSSFVISSTSTQKSVQRTRPVRPLPTSSKNIEDVSQDSNQNKEEKVIQRGKFRPNVKSDTSFKSVRKSSGVGDEAEDLENENYPEHFKSILQAKNKAAKLQGSTQEALSTKASRVVLKLQEADVPITTYSAPKRQKLQQADVPVTTYSAPRRQARVQSIPLMDESPEFIHDTKRPISSEKFTYKNRPHISARNNKILDDFIDSTPEPNTKSTPKYLRTYMFNSTRVNLLKKQKEKESLETVTTERIIKFSPKAVVQRTKPTTKLGSHSRFSNEDYNAIDTPSSEAYTSSVSHEVHLNRHVPVQQSLVERRKNLIRNSIPYNPKNLLHRKKDKSLTIVHEDNQQKESSVVVSENSKYVVPLQTGQRTNRFSSRYKSPLNKPPPPVYNPTVPSVTSTTAWLKFFVTDAPIPENLTEPICFVAADGQSQWKSNHQIIRSSASSEHVTDEGEENDIYPGMEVISFTQPRSTPTSDSLITAESTIMSSRLINVETSNHSPSVTVSIFDALADILTSTPKIRTSTLKKVEDLNVIGVSTESVSGSTKGSLIKDIESTRVEFTVQSESDTPQVTTNKSVKTTPRSTKNHSQVTFKPSSNSYQLSSERLPLSSSKSPTSNRKPLATLILYSTTLSPTHKPDTAASTEQLNTDVSNENHSVSKQSNTLHSTNSFTPNNPNDPVLFNFAFLYNFITNTTPPSNEFKKRFEDLILKNFNLDELQSLNSSSNKADDSIDFNTVETHSPRTLDIESRLGLDNSNNIAVTSPSSLETSLLGSLESKTDSTIVTVTPSTASTMSWRSTIVPDVALHFNGGTKETLLTERVVLHDNILSTFVSGRKMSTLPVSEPRQNTESNEKISIVTSTPWVEPTTANRPIDSTTNRELYPSVNIISFIPESSTLNDLFSTYSDITTEIFASGSVTEKRSTVAYTENLLDQIGSTTQFSHIENPVTVEETKNDLFNFVEAPTTTDSTTKSIETSNIQSTATTLDPIFNQFEKSSPFAMYNDPQRGVIGSIPFTTTFSPMSYSFEESTTFPSHNNVKLSNKTPVHNEATTLNSVFNNFVKSSVSTPYYDSGSTVTSFTPSVIKNIEVSTLSHSQYNTESTHASFTPSETTTLEPIFNNFETSTLLSVHKNTISSDVVTTTPLMSHSTLVPITESTTPIVNSNLLTILNMLASFNVNASSKSGVANQSLSRRAKLLKDIEKIILDNDIDLQNNQENTINNSSINFSMFNNQDLQAIAIPALKDIMSTIFPYLESTSTDKLVTEATTLAPSTQSHSMQNSLKLTVFPDSHDTMNVVTIPSTTVDEINAITTTANTKIEHTSTQSQKSDITTEFETSTVPSTTPSYQWVPPFPTAWRNKQLSISKSSEIQTYSALSTTTERATTTSRPKKDYYIYGVLPNNTVVRKNPNNNELETLTEASPFIVFGVLPNNSVIRKYPNGTRVPPVTQKVEILPIDPGTLKNPNSPVYKDPESIKPVNFNNNNVDDINTNEITHTQLTANMERNNTINHEIKEAPVHITEKMLSENISKQSSVNNENSVTGTTESYVLNLLTTAKLPKVEDIVLSSIEAASREELSKYGSTEENTTPRYLTLDIDPETKKIRTEKPPDGNERAVFRWKPVPNEILTTPSEGLLGTSESNIQRITSTLRSSTTITTQASTTTLTTPTTIPTSTDAFRTTTTIPSIPLIVARSKGQLGPDESSTINYDYQSSTQFNDVQRPTPTTLFDYGFTTKSSNDVKNVEIFPTGKPQSISTRTPAVSSVTTPPYISTTPPYISTTIRYTSTPVPKRKSTTTQAYSTTMQAPTTTTIRTTTGKYSEPTSRRSMTTLYRSPTESPTTKRRATEATARRRSTTERPTQTTRTTPTTTTSLPYELSSAISRLNYFDIDQSPSLSTAPPPPTIPAKVASSTTKITSSTTSSSDKSTFSVDDDIAFLTSLQQLVMPKAETKEQTLANRIIALAVERNLVNLKSSTEAPTSSTGKPTRATTQTTTTTTTEPTSTSDSYRSGKKYNIAADNDISIDGEKSSVKTSTPSIEEDLASFQKDAQLLQSLLKLTGQDPTNIKIPVIQSSSSTTLRETIAGSTRQPQVTRGRERNSTPKPSTGSSSTKTLSSTKASTVDVDKLKEDAVLIQNLIKIQNAGEATTIKLNLDALNDEKALAALLADVEKPTSTSAPLKLSTEYGHSNEALLAALLKDQGIGPTTPQDQKRLAALLNQVVVTPKLRATTTRRPPPTTRQPRPILDGLAWLWQQWQDTGSGPSGGSRGTRRPVSGGGGGFLFGSGPFVGNADDDSQSSGNKVPLPPPQVVDSSSSSSTGLVTAAINVTRAFSQFLGAAIQGAASTFQSVVRAGTRAAGNYYSSGSG